MLNEEDRAKQDHDVSKYRLLDENKSKGVRNGLYVARASGVSYEGARVERRSD